MSLLSLITSDGNPIDIMSANILFPYFGNWSAHLVLANAESAPQGMCTLSLFGNDYTSYVIPTRSSDSEGRFYAMAIGGAGGLSSSISPKMYNSQIQVQFIVSDLLSEVGESISSTSSQSLLSTIIPGWTRMAGSASVALSQLIDSVGGIWRVLSDGSVFIGTDSFVQAASFDSVVLYQDPVHANATLATQTLALVPGQRFPTSPYDNLSNRKIGCCQYQVSPDQTTLTCWFLEESGVYTDPLHEGLESFIKEVMRGIDYLANYPCEVLMQRADGTVDLQPDSGKIPMMTSVPMLVPVRGSKLRAKPKDRGILLFENGNPQGFRFQLFESGVGGAKVARLGDTVNCGVLTITAVSDGVFTGTYVDGSGTSTTIALGTPIPIKGKIDSGSPDFEILAGNT